MTLTRCCTSAGTLWPWRMPLLPCNACSRTSWWCALGFPSLLYRVSSRATSAQLLGVVRPDLHQGLVCHGATGCTVHKSTSAVGKGLCVVNGLSSKMSLMISTTAAGQLDAAWCGLDGSLSCVLDGVGIHSGEQQAASATCHVWETRRSAYTQLSRRNILKLWQPQAAQS